MKLAIRDRENSGENSTSVTPSTTNGNQAAKPSGNYFQFYLSNFSNTVNDRYSKPNYDRRFTLLYWSVYYFDRHKQITIHFHQVTPLSILVTLLYWYFTVSSFLGKIQKPEELKANSIGGNDEQANESGTTIDNVNRTYTYHHFDVKGCNYYYMTKRSLILHHSKCRKRYERKCARSKVKE